MNTIYDFNNLQSKEMLWTEVSNAFQTELSNTIQEVEKVIAETMVKEFFKNNLTKNDAVLGLCSLIALKIVDTSIPINQDQIPPEKSQPTIIQNQARPKSRRRPRQELGFFTVQDFLALKGN